MPLNTIPANIPRSRSYVGSSSKGFSDIASSKSSIPTAPPPMAVQSMLRSTTELGDVGQLPLTRSHRSRSVSHMRSTRRRSGSFGSSIASGIFDERSSYLRHDGRQYGSRHVPSMPNRSRHGTVRSSSESHSYNSRSRNTRARIHPHGYQGLTNTAIPPRSLYSHRSLITLRNHGENRSRSFNSGSPLAPRHQGSGAYGVPPIGFGSGPYHASARLPFPGAGSRGSAASSPASMYPRMQGHPRSYTEGDHSSTPLARWPSPGLHRHASYSRMITHITRHGTPSTTVAHGTRGGSVSSIATRSEMPQSPSGSTAPRYYDYSESFIEEESSRPGNSPRATSYHTLEHQIPENQILGNSRHAQTPFGTRPGSSFHPIELPTKHNRRPSEQSITSLPPSTIPARRSSLGFVSQTIKQERIDENQDELSPHKASIDDEVANRRISSASRKTRESSSSSIFFPNASRSPRDLPALVARIHSPKEEDRRPASSSLEPSPDMIKRVGFLTLGVRSAHQIVNANGCQIHSLNELLDPRPRTSPKARANQDPVIVSPRPERPLSSQSRKQFSKILEIDEKDAQNVEQISEQISVKRSVTRLSCLHEKPSLKQSHESLSSYNEDGEKAFDNIRSLNQDSALSTITSYGKSTVESLLDHHIESLGLIPESYSPQNQHQLGNTVCTTDDDESVSTTKLSDQSLVMNTSAKIRPVTAATHRPSSLDSDAHKRLVPRRLFSSMDARFTSLADILCINKPMDSPVMERGPSISSSGWQTLNSDSQTFGVAPSKPSIMSGEYADIDTTIHSRRFKVRRQSRMTQSSSPPESLLSLAIDPEDKKTEHRRSQSEMIARKESHRRRGIIINLKLEKRSNSVGHIASSGKQNDINDGTKEVRGIKKQSTAGLLPHNGTLAELSGDSAVCAQPVLSSDQSSPVSQLAPDRWSSILAAMPMPNTKTTGVVLPRQTSFRTYRSHRSNTSLAEPVNSTRIGALPSSIGNCAPKLEPSDFGPPLVAEDLKLRTPYLDIANNDISLLRGKKSFLNDSSDFTMPKATKMKFGLSSLRSILPGSSVGTVQGSIRGSDLLQPSQSCRMQGRQSMDDLITPESPTPMSDFAYRKRKIIQKLNNWWNRQCIQKRLALRKRRAAQELPGGMLVGH